MKILILIAIFGVIIWLYGSAIRDIYFGFKERKMKRTLAKLKKEAISSEAEVIIKVGKKKDVNRLGELINATSLDTINEVATNGFQSKFLEKLVKQNPESSQAHYLYGYNLIHQA